MLRYFDTEHPEIGQEIEDKESIVRGIDHKDRRDGKGI